MESLIYLILSSIILSVLWAKLVSQREEEMVKNGKIKLKEETDKLGLKLFIINLTCSWLASALMVFGIYYIGATTIMGLYVTFVVTFIYEMYEKELLLTLFVNEKLFENVFKAKFINIQIVLSIIIFIIFSIYPEALTTGLGLNITLNEMFRFGKIFSFYVGIYKAKYLGILFCMLLFVTIGYFLGQSLDIWKKPEKNKDFAKVYGILFIMLIWYCVNGCVGII